MGMIASLTSFVREVVRGPDEPGLEPAGGAEEQANTDVFRRMIAACNEGDVVRMMGFYDSDFRAAENGVDRPAIGAESDVAPSRDLLLAFPDREIHVEQLVASGDTLVARWTMTGTHRGEWEGVPASGREVATAGCSVYRLAAGKFVRAWHYRDQLSLLEQIDEEADGAAEAG